MNRRAAREAALSVIFEMSFKLPYEAANWRASDEGMDSLSEQTGLFEMPIDDDSHAYIDRAVALVAEHIGEIDGFISKHSKGWKIARLNRLCLAAMRLCICELRYMGDEIPAAVSINEAVRIVKDYDADDSSAFVNGVLGAYYRAEHGTPEAAASPETES